jgi:hypothetical protein
MISLIGIGEAGCNVVSLFEEHKTTESKQSRRM